MIAFTLGIHSRMQKVTFGINLSHDMSCAAVVDGRVAVAIEEERLIRRKHCDGKTHLGPMIPFAAVNYCLESLGLSAGEVDLWVGSATFPNAEQVLRTKLIGIDPARITEVPFPGHHLAHALSAFYASPYHEAAVLVLDVNGASDGRRKENYSIYHGRGTSLNLVFRDFVYPGEISLGEWYTICAAVLQLSPMRDGPYGDDDPHSSAGKLMGYAAYASQLHAAAPLIATLEELVNTSKDRFVIKIPRFVEYLQRSGRVDGIVSPERLSQVFGSRIQHCVRWKYREDSLKAPHNILFARDVQSLLEQAVMRMALIANSKTGCSDLCVAGGTMLNTAANRCILSSTPIRNLFVQPAANDAGTAIGAAFYGQFLDQRMSSRSYLDAPYSTNLGKQYCRRDIDAALQQPRSSALEQIPLATVAEQVNTVAKSLHERSVVAIFKGRSEFGPRALGNRSLLASPCSPQMLQRMNAIKRREWYRPLAPLVPEDELSRYFDAPFSHSPYMTINAMCRPETALAAPAICHADSSARVQTVSANESPFIYAVLKRFAEISRQPPILVNTSFNISEPIVETPMDAVLTFLEADGAIDHMLLEDRWISPPSALSRRG